MSNDEQMAIIGRMVTERKELRAKESALLDEVLKASKGFGSLSGLLENYREHYSIPLSIPPAITGLVDSDNLTQLVNELLAVRQEQHDLHQRLKQAGID